MAPLVIIDCVQQVAANPDYCITIQDVRDWERQWGEIPRGSFVVMATEWSRRWRPDEGVAMRNADLAGCSHYPGWSREVLEFLLRDRAVSGIGHETTDTDPGVATSRGDYSLEHFVLSNDVYQVEMLASLRSVPRSGALVVVGVPKIHGASGFPARVLAIAP